MKKTLATTIALTSVVAFSTPSLAQTITIPTFEAAIQYDVTAPVEDTYKSIRKQSRQACKDQIRSVKSLQLRHSYLKSCTSELLAAAVEGIEMEALQHYHAKKHDQPVTKKYAQVIR